MTKPELQFPNDPLQLSTIRPIGVYALSGLTTDRDCLLAVDAVRGYLVSIDPHTNNTIVLNPHHVSDWIGVNGLNLWGDTLWFAKGQEVLWCDFLTGTLRERPHGDLSDSQTLAPTVFTRLPYPVNGVAVWASTVYVSCQKSGYINIFDRHTGALMDLW